MVINVNTPWVQMAAQEIREHVISRRREYAYPTIEKIAESIVKYGNWEEDMKRIEKRKDDACIPAGL
jgi:hypothetical protein